MSTAERRASLDRHPVGLRRFCDRHGPDFAASLSDIGAARLPGNRERPQSGNRRSRGVYRHTAGSAPHAQLRHGDVHGRIAYPLSYGIVCTISGANPVGLVPATLRVEHRFERLVRRLGVLDQPARDRCEPRPLYFAVRRLYLGRLRCWPGDTLDTRHARRCTLRHRFIHASVGARARADGTQGGAATRRDAWPVDAHRPAHGARGAVRGVCLRRD